MKSGIHRRPRPSDPGGYLTKQMIKQDAPSGRLVPEERSTKLPREIDVMNSNTIDEFAFYAFIPVATGSSFGWGATKEAAVEQAFMALVMDWSCYVKVWDRTVKFYAVSADDFDSISIDYDNTLHVKRDDEDEYRTKSFEWRCEVEIPAEPKRWGDGTYAKARKIARAASKEWTKL